jgi:hypothetical protein
MRLFTHANGRQVLVPVGFSYWCFFFGGLYGLVTLNWSVVVASFATHFVCATLLFVGCPHALVALLGFAANLFVSACCNGWRMETLRERGYDG